MRKALSRGTSPFVTRMATIWPEDFQRIPDDSWTRDSVDEMARAYDEVGQHGWYANIDPTVDELAAFLDPGDILVDYSGGTGLLIDRLLDRELEVVGILNTDSSAKFLRLCLEKFASEERVALRRIPYLEEEQRLAYVDEVLDASLQELGIDAVASTNAIHLYHDLLATLASWRRILTPEGRVFVQSGNIARDDRPDGRWIIDRTVEAVDREARVMVREDENFAAHRGILENSQAMEEYDALRERYFLPARPASHYRQRFGKAGFQIEETTHRAIEVERTEWAQFLKVYHQGVLGWVGGAEKITGQPAEEGAIEARHELIDRALERVLEGEDTFEAEWTYWTLTPS